MHDLTTVYERPKALKDVPTHYCPGCTHGIIHRIIGEVIDELGILGDTVGIASVGCSVLAYEYFNCDCQQAAHGRAPAVATGIKRAYPDTIVFTYQGDGDLASIGLAEIIHAANRNENISVIFVNNGIYGMTSGQMAPTTLIDQITSTSPYGRNPKVEGYPLRVSEMLATLEGPRYIARTSVHNPKNVIKTKKAVNKAFRLQIEGKGFSMVEILSTCATNWKMSSREAIVWLAENMIPYYPLGDIKDEGDDN